MKKQIGWGLLFCLFAVSLARAQVVGPLPLDHFKCYQAESPVPPFPLLLRDQFDERMGIIEQVQLLGVAHLFCNPVVKFHRGRTRIVNPNNHLTWYPILPIGPPPPVPFWQVTVTNQFGTQDLQMPAIPRFLAVPTQKIEPGLGPFSLLDHFKCYDTTAPQLNVRVNLLDQFHRESRVLLRQAVFFCNPVVKIRTLADGTVETTPIVNPLAHLTCYQFDPTPFGRSIQIINQFTPPGAVFPLSVFQPNFLCVPSVKNSFNPGGGV